MFGFCFDVISGVFIAFKIWGIHCGFINLDPFLLHTENCYTNLIIYEPYLNIFTTTFPVSVSTPSFGYGLKDKSCRPHLGNLGSLRNTKDGLCDLVRRNFHSYRITCVAITLVDSRNTSDINDAYWYLINYWSNKLWVDRKIIVPRNTTPVNWWLLSENQEDAFHMVLFPSKAYLHILANAELKVWGRWTFFLEIFTVLGYFIWTLLISEIN